jgi:hypothetical protein
VSPLRNVALAARAAHASPAAVDPKRKRIALAIAALADIAQVGGFPIFSEGVLSIPDDVLDAVVALTLVFVLGFRWRLLLTLALELVPGLTLFPTWTAVVLSLPTAAPELPAPAPSTPSTPSTAAPKSDHSA